MQLAHALDDQSGPIHGRARRRGNEGPPRRPGWLSAMPMRSWSALVLVPPTLDDRLGECHPLEDDRRVCDRGERVSRWCVSFRPSGAAMAPARLLRCLRGCSHASAACGQPLPSCRFTEFGTRLVERTRIDAGEGERADERVAVTILNASSDNGAIVGRRTRISGVSLVGLRGLERPGMSSGEGQIVDDRIEQRLNTRVLERRAAEDRNVNAGASGHLRIGFLDPAYATFGTECLRDRLHRRRLVRRRVQRRISRYSAALSARSAGISSIGVFGAEAFVLPDDRALVDQVDETLEVAFGADGADRGRPGSHRGDR